MRVRHFVVRPNVQHQRLPVAAAATCAKPQWPLYRDYETFRKKNVRAHLPVGHRGLPLALAHRGSAQKKLAATVNTTSNSPGKCQ